MNSRTLTVLQTHSRDLEDRADFEEKLRSTVDGLDCLLDLEHQLLLMDVLKGIESINAILFQFEDPLRESKDRTVGVAVVLQNAVYLSREDLESDVESHFESRNKSRLQFEDWIDNPPPNRPFALWYGKHLRYSRYRNTAVIPLLCCRPSYLQVVLDTLWREMKAWDQPHLFVQIAVPFSQVKEFLQNQGFSLATVPAEQSSETRRRVLSSEAPATLIKELWPVLLARAVERRLTVDQLHYLDTETNQRRTRTSLLNDGVILSKQIK
jgi:hypothetical protein